MVDNEAAIRRAQGALRHYAVQSAHDREQVTDAVADMLLDLLHWTERVDISFEDALALARERYRAE